MIVKADLQWPQIRPLPNGRIIGTEYDYETIHDGLAVCWRA
jgi:hypothetical protein